MIKTLALTVLVALAATACVNAGGRMETSGSASCAQPPTGTIRFALLSGAEQATVYDWQGTTYRQTHTEPTGPALIGKFPSGAIYKWNHWGPEVVAVPRTVSGHGKLSTPYALNRDARLVVAGLQSEDEYSPPTRVAIVRLSDGGLQSILDIERPILSLAWSPTSDQLAILTATERYGNSTARERLSNAIGHPIPYSDIVLSIARLDGSIVCSIHPADDIDYGNGYVRWDDA